MLALRLLARLFRRLRSRSNLSASAPGMPASGIRPVAPSPSSGRSGVAATDRPRMVSVCD